ncbi:hypothetical protein JR316_0003076 [Psilocybe cubensis]|uniref:Uncharacterized protein n=1 Tax=Psilocybe cubensis TaxID=181762 RepID=A0ACB8H6R9_PSICU|nr:hypothetical protein JR316_0003076 [Psilocybe cubensis]KAH9483606.1 hypothetical protein JR316_0003076 [Psilocybe cubensis]
MSRSSPSPSSSSRSSITPPPQTVEKKKKTSSKSKKTDHGKNEGVDPNWAYKPPPGAALVKADDVNGGEFDWDKINNDEDLELWLIRVPDSVKPKHLENLTVDVPSSSTSTCIGTLKRKHTAFDIWSVGDNGDNIPIGGEEIKSISCLLPRSSKKGKLYPVPKPIAQHVVIAAQPVVPTLPSNGEPALQYQNPPRHSYPKEILKHRFTPFNSVINTESDAAKMEVDAPEPPASPKKKRAKTTDVSATNEDTPAVEPETESKKSKTKKRKGESGDAAEISAKKAKKTKVA